MTRAWASRRRLCSGCFGRLFLVVFCCFKHYRGVQASSSLFSCLFGLLWASLGFSGPQASLMFPLLRELHRTRARAGRRSQNRHGVGARFTLYPDVGLRETWCGRRLLAFRWRNAVREAVRLGRSLWFRRVGAAPSSVRNTGGLHGSTPQDWPSLRLSGAACARRKAVRGRCPARTRKPALSKNPFFFCCYTKKDASRSRKEVAHGHESKGFTLHLVSCMFLKKLKTASKSGGWVHVRARAARAARVLRGGAHSPPVRAPP